MKHSELVKLNNMAVLARRRRGKKKGSLRSQMLRMIMPMLSQENGERLSKAIADRNSTAARAVMDKIKNELSQKLAVEASSDSPSVNIDVNAAFERIAESIFEDLPQYQLPEQTATSRDVSFVIENETRQAELTQWFLLNGYVELRDANDSSAFLTLLKVESHEEGDPQPIVTVSAVLKGKDRQLLSASGELGAAFSEIILSAMMLVSGE